MSDEPLEHNRWAAPTELGRWRNRLLKQLGESPEYAEYQKRENADPDHDEKQRDQGLLQPTRTEPAEPRWPNLVLALENCVLIRGEVFLDDLARLPIIENILCLSAIQEHAHRQEYHECRSKENRT